MKICFIFRPKEYGAFSIENVFTTIIKELRRKYPQIEIEYYYRNKSLFQSFFEVLRLKADIYHITGAEYLLALLLPRSKTIITMHDTARYKNYQHGLRRFFIGLLAYALPMYKVKYLVSISQLTKTDIIQGFNISANRIEVIDNPLTIDVKYNEREFNKNNPVILQVGSSVQKNLKNLIEAVKGLQCRLEIVGNPEQKLIERMKEYRIDYNLSFRIFEEELVEKYNQCDIVYFASLYEGFGLPIIEAQTVGRALIISNTSSLPAVSGGCAHIVDPYNVEQIRDGIIKLCEDDNYRQEIIRQGVINATKYDVKDIVQRYYEIYQEIILKTKP